MRARIRRSSLVLLGTLALAAACQATPLPMPPATADPARMMLLSRPPDAITLAGASGAVSPGGTTLRVTGPTGTGQADVRADGSFNVSLAGTTTDVLYLESLADTDVFLAAVTGGPPGSVTAADPGPDRDGDGSPDAIDCAPDDRTQSGRRCPPPPMCIPMAEICNGLDDDCDGLIDDGACGCPAGLVMCGADCIDVAIDASNCGTCATGCAAGETCQGGVCSPSACVSDADCASGQVCRAGLCAAS